jgi:hypothetical protein
MAWAAGLVDDFDFDELIQCANAEKSGACNELPIIGHVHRIGWRIDHLGPAAAHVWRRAGLCLGPVDIKIVPHRRPLARVKQRLLVLRPGIAQAFDRRDADGAIIVPATKQPAVRLHQKYRHVHCPRTVVHNAHLIPPTMQLTIHLLRKRLILPSESSKPGPTPRPKPIC